MFHILVSGTRHWDCIHTATRHNILTIQKGHR